MIRLATLLALAGAAQAQAPAAPATGAVAREIVVIGQKLRTWQGGVTKEQGRLVCRTRKSSGDPRLDAIRCGAMLTCTRPIEAKIDRLMSSDASRTAKRDGFAALLASAKPCLEAYEAEAVARLAAERAAE